MHEGLRDLAWDLASDRFPASILRDEQVKALFRRGQPLDPHRCHREAAGLRCHVQLGNLAEAKKDGLAVSSS